MWYDNSQLLSYNKILSFVIGNRGGGKTYNATKWCINDFIKNGNQFVWVRRYKTELGKIGQFFNAIQADYPNLDLKIKGRTAYINDKIAGYFIPLSISQREKSTAYPKVNKIIFDEFLIDKGNLRYIDNEVDVYLELFETVARTRDNVRGVFLGNNISTVNPYFLYWDLKINKNKRFNVYDDLVIEMYKDNEYINMKSKTRFGKLVANTAYGDYAIENESLRDNDIFIENKTSDSKCKFIIKYLNRMYGVWVDYNVGKIFICNKTDVTCKKIYSITTNDHEPNMLLIREMKNTSDIKTLKFTYNLGMVRFDNQVTKQQFVEFYKFL